MVSLRTAFLWRQLLYVISPHRQSSVQKSEVFKRNTRQCLGTKLKIQEKMQTQADQTVTMERIWSGALNTLPPALIVDRYLLLYCSY